MTAKLFQLNIFVLRSFKLECHSRTLQEENRTVNAIIQLVILNSSAINKISRVHTVGTPCISIAETVAQAS